ncbi:MAG: molecular chaperone DnaK [Anaerolineae bacterium]
MGRPIGIDLGTTNSVIATLEGGRPVIIPNREGARLTPSAVSIASGRRWVGRKARHQALMRPEETALSIKRRMGEDCRLSLAGKPYTPVELSAMILTKLKEDAQAFLDETIDKAVITVPAYFNDAQRQATRNAGEIAGLEVVRIVNEPTAAALAYGLDREEVQTAIVWDLGGGTFDVSILEIGEGVFEVRAVNGNTRLGGDDYDRRIMDLLADKVLEEKGGDLRRDPVAWQRLRNAAEEAKIELSKQETATVRIPAPGSGTRHLEYVLSREEFEAATADLTRSLLGPTRQALTDAAMEPADIDRAILVGGSTRMPAVRRAVREMMGQDPYLGLNPDEVVAIGAAVQAGIVAGEIGEVVLVDVTPLSLGIQTLGGLFTRLIPRNTPIPTTESQIFTTAEDNQTAMDIHVLQGEREMARDNMSLGTFTLEDVPPQPRGELRLEVSFHIDADGIVQVAATDLETEKEQRIRVNGAARLAHDDVERMVREASTHAEEDRRLREHVETRIEAEGLIHAAHASLEESRERAEANECQKLREGLQTLEAIISADESGDIGCAVADLRERMKRFHRELRYAS